MVAKLTEQQLHFFETFGFIRFPGLLQDSISWITEQFERNFDYSRSGHDGTSRTIVYPFIDNNEKLCSLLDDSRIEGIGASILGDDFNYVGSDGNYYTGNTQWHRDGAHRDYRHIKIAFYLDRLDGDNGALRVIPGSHKLGDAFSDAVDNIAKCEQTLGITGHEVPAVVLSVEPGDVLAFDHSLLHSAWGGGKARRMFTLNLCERHAEEHMHILKHNILGLRKYLIERSGYRVVLNDSRTLVETADANRMRHIEQMLAVSSDAAKEESA